MVKDKTSKYRGSRTCGGGNAKKRRGGGSKGGRGNAGPFKHHFVRTMLIGVRRGKYGFKRPPSLIEEKNVINVGKLDEIAQNLVSMGFATEEGGFIKVDVENFGIDKVLGSGSVRKNILRVTSKAFSVKAVEKIGESGGEVIFAEANMPE